MPAYVESATLVVATMSKLEIVVASMSAGLIVNVALACPAASVGTVTIPLPVNTPRGLWKVT